MHAISTPLLILTALGLVQRMEAQWSAATPGKVLAMLTVIALIAFGFWTDLNLPREPVERCESYARRKGSAYALAVSGTQTMTKAISTGMACRSDCFGRTMRRKTNPALR